MSDHDPLCPAIDGPERCRCPFIARIRADQATKSYREGYNDCAAAKQRTLIEYGGRPKLERDPTR